MEYLKLNELTKRRLEETFIVIYATKMKLRSCSKKCPLKNENTYSKIKK